MFFLTSKVSITEQLDAIIDTLLQTIPRIIVAFLILIIGFTLCTVVRKMIVRLFSRNHTDKTVLTFITSFSNVGLRLIVVVMAIASLGVNINGILAALGTAGLTIGLSLKDSLSNVASGLLILINKPIRANDYIRVDGFEGNVKKIEIMFTTLLTPENNNVVMPNSKMLQSSIINYTMEEQRRMDLSFVVSYEENIHRVKDLLRNVAITEPLVVEKKGIVTGVTENQPVGVCVVLQVHCHYKDYEELKFRLQERIKLEFDRQKILRA